jgi:predicted  nucleic acid-binding Zn-ribbon protein
MYIIYNMSNIDTLKNRLLELSNRLKLKDEMGKDYKKIVSDSLARIKAKITKILADHNKKVKDITDGSAENLEKTRAELAAQQARLKQASDAALEAAKRNQDKLQNNLDDTNKQLNDLQSELNKPNPDTQNMQVIIEKLRQDLQNAQNDSAAANAQIAQLTERLKAYDGMRDKMDELVKNLLTKIGDILAQVDAMSINQTDITELLQLLNETEDMFPKDDGAPPGNDDGGGIFGNLFGGPPSGAGAGAGAGGPSIYAAPQGNSAGSGLPAPRIPRGANTAPGQSAVVPIPPRDQNAGKTKRRRGKKTMRGGYVEKLRAKKTRKRARTSKRRSGRSTASSSSSSSSSSNSRQKSMQGRKM